MSHHILPSLISSLEWDALDSMTREIIKFHDDYRREAADLAILAYQHNTYTKVRFTFILSEVFIMFLCVKFLVRTWGRFNAAFIT